MVLGTSSMTVYCRPDAGPMFQSCPRVLGLVWRLGSSIGSIRTVTPWSSSATADAADRPILDEDQGITC